MRIRKDIDLREVGGKMILIACEQNLDLSNVLCLNETANFIWKEASRMTNFTTNDLVNILIKEYDIDEKIAFKDTEELINRLIKLKLILI